MDYDPRYGIQGQRAAAQPTKDEYYGTAGKWAPTRPPGTGGFAGYRSFSRWTFAPYAVGLAGALIAFFAAWPFLIFHGVLRYIVGVPWLALLLVPIVWFLVLYVKAAPVRQAARRAARNTK